MLRNILCRLLMFQNWRLVDNFTIIAESKDFSPYRWTKKEKKLLHGLLIFVYLNYRFTLLFIRRALHMRTKINSKVERTKEFQFL